MLINVFCVTLVQTKKLILEGFTRELHRITKVQKNLFSVVCMEVKSQNLKHNLLPELLTSLLEAL